jgi:peptidylprolyl isomerase
MSQKRKSTPPPPPPPPTNNLPAILSAVAVIVVLGLIGVLLFNRNGTASTNTPGSVANTQATSAPQALAVEPTVAAATPLPTVEPRSFSYSAPPPLTIDPSKNYTATITTPRGPIVIKLRPDIAPQTVNNFVFLAREGFYNGLTWHRVIEGFMAQGGDPDGTGMGGPGYTVPEEFTDQILFDRPGIVATARRSDTTNSSGSQFFITTAPAEHLNAQYTIFGEVISGQDIVAGIPLRDPQLASGPGEQMLKIEITEE